MTGRCLLIYRPTYDEDEGNIYRLDSVCLFQVEVDDFLAKHAKYKPYGRTAFKVVEFETGTDIDINYSYDDSEDAWHLKCPTCGITTSGIGYIIPIEGDRWLCMNGHKFPMEWFVEYIYLDGAKRKVPFKRIIDAT